MVRRVQCHCVCPAIGEFLGDLHCTTAPRIGEQMPMTPQAGAAPQPHFPATKSPNGRVNHDVRIRARQPLRLSHASGPPSLRRELVISLTDRSAYHGLSAYPSPVSIVQCRSAYQALPVSRAGRLSAYSSACASLNRSCQPCQGFSCPSAPFFLTWSNQPASRDTGSSNSAWNCARPATPGAQQFPVRRCLARPPPSGTPSWKDTRRQPAAERVICSLNNVPGWCMMQEIRAADLPRLSLILVLS